MRIDKQQGVGPKTAQRTRQRRGKDFATAEPPLQVDLNACIKHVGSRMLREDCPNRVSIAIQVAFVPNVSQPPEQPDEKRPRFVVGNQFFQRDREELFLLLEKIDRFRKTKEPFVTVVSYGR